MQNIGQYAGTPSLTMRRAWNTSKSPWPASATTTSQKFLRKPTTATAAITAKAKTSRISASEVPPITAKRM